MNSIDMQYRAAILSILEEIAPETEFSTSEDYFKDGLLDSFEVILLTNELEKRFQISIPGAYITPENYSSISSLTSLLQRVWEEKTS